MPKISIIIPLYNHKHAIGKCLDSIISQSINDFEVIIVNDGSTDSPDDVIGAYAAKFNSLDKRYHIINQPNRGANAARNRGFREAQGKFLLFCDADVVMEPVMLETMVKTLEENPQASYAYCAHKFGRKLFRLFAFSAERLRTMPYIHTSSLIRREYFTGFDENVKRLQDWDLWLTMLEQGHSGVWIDQVLFSYSPGGTMSAWLPSFAYKLLPFLPQVKRYKAAVGLIKAKHKLG
jgi:glycosyltransferase involved in cell wall biosynthesis